MTKSKIKKIIKPRNIMALSLQLPQFKMRVIKNKKKEFKRFNKKECNHNNHTLFY